MHNLLPLHAPRPPSTDRLTAQLRPFLPPPSPSQTWPNLSGSGCRCVLSCTCCMAAMYISCTVTNTCEASHLPTVSLSASTCVSVGRYLGPDYGDLQRPAGEVAAADLPRLAHESFPLCMLVQTCSAHRLLPIVCWKSMYYSCWFPPMFTVAVECHSAGGADGGMQSAW